MEMMKFPIQFDSTGLKKLEEGTEEFYSQILSISLLTEPSTHPFTPQFGASDPSFTTIDKGLFVLNCARFVPEIRITSLSNELINNGDGAKVTFSFEIQER